MRRELLANFFDTTNEATSEITAPEFFSHNINDAVPEVLADAFVNAGIAKHNKLPACRNDEEQDAIAVFCAHHSQPRECFFRGLMDIAPKEWGNRDADLARSAVL